MPRIAVEVKPGRREQELLRGWPAGIAPTRDELVAAATRRYPKLHPSEREGLVRRTLAFVHQRPRERVSELDARPYEEMLEAPAGRISIVAVPDASELVRIVHDRVVYRAVLYEEVFTIAKLFDDARARIEWRWGHPFGGEGVRRG